MAIRQMIQASDPTWRYCVKQNPIKVMIGGIDPNKIKKRRNRNMVKRFITPFPEDFKLHSGFMGGYEKREIIVVAENKSSAAYKSQ
jgi:hypothetical protein